MGKKICLIFIALIFSGVVFGAVINPFGIVKDEDFLKVGVSNKNLNAAKDLMNKAMLDSKKAQLEIDQLEIEASRYILDTITDKQLKELDKIYDKMCVLQASQMKARVRTQLKLLQYITRDQYIRARSVATQRLQGSQVYTEQHMIIQTRN
ncbi:MAG: hypothetical protein ACRCSK_00810 [Fusobacteriaceae bacterium]